jgi:murein DD-endopeptidase MepM/ murein hydrolase activator NlpD
MRQCKALSAVFGAKIVKITASVGVAALLAGCSSDSTRLSETFSHPFANPFSSSSVAEAAPSATAAPTPKVVAQPLASSATAPVQTASVAAAQPAQPVTGFKGNWSTTGGSPVIVGATDNLSSVSQRYGVPSSAILSANGLSSAAQVKPGARIIIPVYNGAGGVAAAGAAKIDKPETDVADAAPAPAPLKAKAAKKKAAEDGAASDVADAAPIPGLAKRPAKSTAPAPSVALATPVPAPAGKTSAKAPLTPAPQPSNLAVAVPVKPTVKKSLGAETDPQPTASLQPQSGAAEVTSAQADANGSNPEFRWPARGRIIQGFKSGGNDGINISVPEGTSVRAAESGVVAYAGSDLKGYGNLVLIRHPNGFVTAYANNGELDVKRGDTVKRGQIVAKSGSSGNVNAPQLHFELRKNSQPVDPTDYLAGL